MTDKISKNFTSIIYEDFYIQIPQFCDKDNKYQSKIRYNYNGKKQLFLTKTPELIVKDIKFDEENKKYIITLNIDKKYKYFYEFFLKIDKMIIERIKSCDWFSKEISNNIENLYKSPIKILNNEEYHEIYLTIPINDGNILCKIYDVNEYKRKISINDLNINTKITALLEFKNVIYEQSNFYPVLNIFYIEKCANKIFDDKKNINSKLPKLELSHINLDTNINLDDSSEDNYIIENEIIYSEIDN